MAILMLFQNIVHHILNHPRIVFAVNENYKKSGSDQNTDSKKKLSLIINIFKK